MILPSRLALLRSPVASCHSLRTAMTGASDTYKSTNDIGVVQTQRSNNGGFPKLENCNCNGGFPKLEICNCACLPY